MEGRDFAAVITGWYASHGRPLPWRETRDPYRIWISEVILQQTRVGQGLGYYRRFLERFPDVRTLAEADEDDVMRQWQGLGYYSRARNLHAAAKSIGTSPFPSTYKDLRALKGVGDYTAAAVASIAYGLPHAVVDGNVYRVLARYFGISDPIDTTQGKKLFAGLARQLLDEAHPGLYNQALMDFGALQCTPSAPHCPGCPLADSCIAYAAGTVGTLPVKAGKTKTRQRWFSVLLATNEDSCYIRKRTADDIWRGLWEFPIIEAEKAFPDVRSLVESNAFLRIFGDRNAIVTPVRKGIRHQLTHQTIFADFYRVELADRHCPDGFLKVKTDALQQYAFPRLLLPFLPGRDDS